MKAIFINCENADFRRNWMEKCLRKTGINALRYDAVLSGSEREKRSLLALSDSGVSTSLSGNELSCFLSHFNVWRIVAEGSDEKVLVLEDDLFFSSHFRAVIDAIENHEFDFDIVRLEAWQGDGITSQKAENLSTKIKLYALNSISGGAAAYILSKAGARKLIDLSKTIDMAVDLFLFRQDSPVPNKLKIFTIIPCVAIQHDTLFRKRRNRLSKAWQNVSFVSQLSSGRLSDNASANLAPAARDTQEEPVLKVNPDSVEKHMHVPPKSNLVRQRAKKELSNLKREIVCLFRQQKVQYFGIMNDEPVLPDQ